VDIIRCFGTKYAKDKEDRRFEEAIHACSKRNDYEGCLFALQEIRRRGLKVSDSALSTSIQTCTKFGQWEKGAEVFEYALNRGNSMSNSVYLAAIEAYRCGKNGDKIWEVFKHIPAPNEEVYSASISSLAECKHNKFLQLLSKVNSKGISVHLNSYEVAALACESSGMYGEASILREKLEKKRLMIFETMRNKMVRGEHQACLSLFSNLLKQGVWQYSEPYAYTMTSLGAAQRWKDILKVYQQIPKFDMISDEQHLLALMACKNTGQSQEAVQLLKNPKMSMFQQECFSERVLEACIAAKDFNSIRDLAIVSLKYDSAVCQKLYVSMFLFLNTCRQHAEVITLFQVVQEHGLGISLEMCKQVLSAYVALNKGAEAHAFLMDIYSSANVSPDVECVDMTISALSNEGNLEEAFALFESITELEIEPQASTLGEMMRACNAANEPMKCLQVYETAIANSKIRRNHMIFRNLITAYCNLQDPSSAFAAIQEMSNKGVRPTTALFNIVLEACQQNGNISLAEKVFENMSSMGLPADQRTYSAVLMASGRAGRIDQSFGYMKEINHRNRRKKKKNKTHDLVTYNRLISACELWGKYDKALSILEEMEKKGISPDVVSFQSTMICCDRGDRPDLAIQLFQKMKSKGIAPNFAVYQIVITYFFKNDNIAEALKATSEAHDHGLFEMYMDKEYAAIDLHGMNTETTLVTVLFVLQHYAAAAFLNFSMGLQDPRLRVTTETAGLFLITGKGINSAMGKPILKPAVLKLLKSQLNVPLKVEEYQTNPGRILICHEEIKLWLQNILAEPNTSHLKSSYSKRECSTDEENIFILDFQKSANEFRVNCFPLLSRETQ